MYAIAPEVQGSWSVVEALACCGRARERLDLTIATLHAIDDECTWRARIVDFLHRELGAQQRALVEVRDQLGFVESALRAASPVPVG